MFPCPICKKLIETKVKEIIARKQVQCSACRSDIIFTESMMNRYKHAAGELIKAESVYEKVLDDLISDAKVIPAVKRADHSS